LETCIYSLSRKTLKHRAGLGLQPGELFGDPGIRRWADYRVQTDVVLQHTDVSAVVMPVMNMRSITLSISTSLISLANGPKTDPLGEAASTT